MAFQVCSSFCWQDTYLIAVLGDHGMTDVGNHGGNTRDETHTALLFVSTDQNHFVPTHQDHLEEYDFLNSGHFFQIDFAATLSSLFNIETPSKSQGRIISPVLDRFRVPSTEHLCYLFSNAMQIQTLIAKSFKDSSTEIQKELRASLVNAFESHYNYLLHSNVTENHNHENIRQSLLKTSKQLYHKFIFTVQQNHVNKATDRSWLSWLTLLIVFCSGIVFFLLWLELKDDDSILFVRNFKVLFSWTELSRLAGETFETVFDDTKEAKTAIQINFATCFSHIRFLSSPFCYLMLLVPFLLNLVSMGSTSFMENEHLFWYYSTASCLAVILGISFR